MIAWTWDYLYQVRSSENFIVKDRLKCSMIRLIGISKVSKSCYYLINASQIHRSCWNIYHYLQ